MNTTFFREMGGYGGSGGGMSEIEKLMKPRFKVIADYPGTGYEVGHILQPHTTYGYDLFPYPAKYPHLFKSLQWWEERKEEEMPQYVKVKLTNGSIRVYNISGKDFFNKEFMRWKFGGHSLNDFLPSTKEEFESQHTEVKK